MKRYFSILSKAKDDISIYIRAEISKFNYVKVLDKHGSNIYVDRLPDKKHRLTTTGKFTTTENIKEFKFTIKNDKHKTGIMDICYLDGTIESHQFKLVLSDNKEQVIWITEQRAMYTVLIYKGEVVDKIDELTITIDRED